MNDDPLLLGATAIAAKGFDGTLNPHQIYRLYEENEGWPIFRVRGKLAARRSAIQTEIARREREALNAMPAAETT